MREYCDRYLKGTQIWGVRYMVHKLWLSFKCLVGIKRFLLHRSGRSSLTMKLSTSVFHLTSTSSATERSYPPQNAILKKRTQVPGITTGKEDSNSN